MVGLQLRFDLSSFEQVMTSLYFSHLYTIVRVYSNQAKAKKIRELSKNFRELATNMKENFRFRLE